jgi:hypothetical protein
MSKKRSILSTVFFVISLLVCLIITVFGGSIVVDSFESIEYETVGEGLGVAFGFVLYLIYGAIGYGISLILGIVATAVAKGKRRLPYAICGIVLPPVLYLVGIALLQYAVHTVGS